MSDPFLERFTASFDFTVTDGEYVFITKVDVDDIISEVHIPTEIMEANEGTSVEDFLVERLMLDLTEGVKHALHEASPEVFSKT